MADGAGHRTVIIVTASTDLQARAVEAELNARQQAGRFPPNVLCFAVPDPSNARVGSGGATFNALLTCQELLASKPGWTLDRTRVFMIHSGGDSQRLPCQSVTGKAWAAMPTCNAQNELDAPVDLLLQSLFDLFADVPSGLVVASSDVLLLIPPGFKPSWPVIGATGLAIPTEKELGPNHGVYQVPTTGGEVRKVDKFWQKATVPELAAANAVRPDDTVLIDTGVRGCACDP
jgi:fucokinase